MLLLALLLAQSVPALLPPEDEPSALACTFEAALRGEKCLYEASSAPGLPRDSSQVAADAGLRACAAVSNRDEGLRKECTKAVAEASLGAQCAVAARLADSQGRLAIEARGCVEAVREAVSRTARAAALPGDCCKCLGAARCAVPPSQCRRELADLAPGAALQSCMSRSCRDACAFSADPLPARSPAAARQNPADKI